MAKNDDLITQPGVNYTERCGKMDAQQKRHYADQKVRKPALFLITFRLLSGKLNAQWKML